MTKVTKEQIRRVNEPKFRPEEIAEILGIDRKGVMRLTNKLLMGYYQFGPRTRRIGERDLEEYLTRTRARARKVCRRRRAELIKCGAIREV
jgi:excisionase family DNA binding protein